MIAPLVPLIAAVAMGIVADRYGEPCQTESWIMIALACGIFAVLTVRRALISSAAVLVAACAVGGGWHHVRWSDMAADDLAWSITETPRPAWVRGMLRDYLGLRKTRGFGFGTNDTERDHDPVRAGPEGDQRRQALASRRGPGDCDRRGRSP